MKKILILLLAATFLTMCKSRPTATGSETKTTVETKYRDDFKSATDTEKNKFLKNLKATAANYSVLIFTQNFKGEKITATNGTKKVYSEYTLSDPKKGLADEVRIDNTLDTKIYDNLTKTEVLIKNKEAKKYKFIYLMKNPQGNTFTLTYSNTLRPME